MNIQRPLKSNLLYIKLFYISQDQIEFEKIIKLITFKLVCQFSMLMINWYSTAYNYLFACNNLYLAISCIYILWDAYPQPKSTQ